MHRRTVYLVVSTLSHLVYGYLDRPSYLFVQTRRFLLSKAQFGPKSHA